MQTDLPTPVRPGRSRPRSTSVAAILLLVLAGAALALEGALRTFGLFLPGTYSVGMYLMRDPTYGLIHVPGATALLRTPEYNVRVDINSQGFRDRELSEQPPPGTRRIVVLGDSFVEGAQVAADQMLTRRLEARLQAAGVGTVEVVNAGVYTWGTAQEYLLLTQQIGRLHPDLVILAFTSANDVSDNRCREDDPPTMRTRPCFVLDHDGSLRLVPFTLEQPSRLKGLWELRDVSYLAKALNGAALRPLVRAVSGMPAEVHELTAQYVADPMLVYATNPTAGWEDAWAITEALIAASAEAARADGSDFLLVNIPGKVEIHDEQWASLTQRFNLKDADWDLAAPSRRLEAMATRQQIAYVDLRPAFRTAASTGRRLYYYTDGHWNADGHDLAAEVIVSALTERCNGAGGASRASTRALLRP